MTCETHSQSIYFKNETLILKVNEKTLYTS
jgi:hypothetical protein